MFQNYKNREAGWCWMNREMNNASRALLWIIHREIQAGLFIYPTSPVPCGAWTVIGVSALLD